MLRVFAPEYLSPYEEHGTSNLTDQAEVCRLLVRGGDERFEVQWDNAAKVTPSGSLVFFAQYVQTGGLLDRLCQGSPLAYSSPNAPQEREVFGTTARICTLEGTMIEQRSWPDIRLPEGRSVTNVANRTISPKPRSEWRCLVIVLS